MTPRLSILGELDGAISRLREQVQGTIMQARLVEYDEAAGVGSILLYGRQGQTARVDSVLALNPETVTDLVGFDCLILSPSGRPVDGCWIIGGASGPSLLYSGLALTRTNTVTASTTAAGDETEAWRVRFTPPADGGALLVSALRLPVVLASVNCRPVATLFGGGGTSRRYVSTFPMERDAYTTAGAVVVLRADSEPYMLEAAESFQAACHAERIDSSQPAEFKTYTSGEAPDGGRLTVAGTRPVLAVHGRIAVPL